MSISVWQILYCKFIVVHFSLLCGPLYWLIDSKICYYFLPKLTRFYFFFKKKKTKIHLEIKASTVFTFAVVIIALSARDVTVLFCIRKKRKQRKFNPPHTKYYRYLKLSLEVFAESLISERWFWVIFTGVEH